MSIRRKVIRLPLWIPRRVHLELRGVLDRRRLAELRQERDVCWQAQDALEPLVTIRIATYDRGPMVVERAIASAIRQTYRNIEILVVGDGATPETVEAVNRVSDPRVRFVNLERASYPLDAQRRWMVVGHAPMNAALQLARGAWIAPLDDDDESTDDRVETLLKAAIEGRLEFVYGKTAVRQPDGSWKQLGSWPPGEGKFTQGAVLYSSRLAFMRYDSRSWLDWLPADWNLWRRMIRAGVRMGYLDRVVYRYYPARHTPDLG